MARGIILIVVAVFITVVVYGLVALIVKMDDIGLSMAERDSAAAQKIGRGLVTGMPKVLTWLSIVGADELGWHWPYSLVHDAERAVQDIANIGGVLSWLINTAISAVIGIAWGIILIGIAALAPTRGTSEPTH